MIGTSNVPSRQILLDALAAAVAAVVTVAVRRVGLEGKVASLYDALGAGGYHLLPNTAVCFTVRDAAETAEAAAEALATRLIQGGGLAGAATWVRERNCWGGGEESDDDSTF